MAKQSNGTEYPEPAEEALPSRKTVVRRVSRRGAEMIPFRNREDAALQLAERLRGRHFQAPLVLAIPRGGVAIGAILAHALGADLDVVLARRLRAPDYPEVALGAISETGAVYLHHLGEKRPDWLENYLAGECRFQSAEIARRRQLYRGDRPAAPITGRSMIVTDDGIATGSTMIAALNVIRAQEPHELLVAVPVGAPESLAEVRRWCDEAVCLLAPPTFRTVGQFYEDFTAVEDAEVVALLRSGAAPSATARRP